MDRPTVVIELADSPHAANDLSAGGVFVPGCTLEINADCALVVRGRTQEIELAARVVYVAPQKGAGLELVGFTPLLRDHLTRILTAWIEEAASAPPLPPDGPIDLGIELEPASAPAPAAETMPEPAPAPEPAPTPAPERAEAVPAAAREPVAAPEPAAAPAAEAAPESATTPAAEAAREPTEAAHAPAPAQEQEAELTEEEKADPAKRRHALGLHERLRGLTLAQQIKAASSPDPQERILLERFYSKNVWEPLLRNPRLTPPEVARLARLGSLPKPLLEIIVSNGAWLQMPEIRRALLANPRLSTDQIVRILRLLPRPELKLAMTQTSYPHAVREAARRLMKDHVGG